MFLKMSRLLLTQAHTHKHAPCSHTDVHTCTYVKQNTRTIHKQVPTTDNAQNWCWFLGGDRNRKLSRDTYIRDLTGSLKLRIHIPSLVI